jgi:hypothetical protein
MREKPRSIAARSTPPVAAGVTSAGAADTSILPEAVAILLRSCVPLASRSARKSTLQAFVAAVQTMRGAWCFRHVAERPERKRGHMRFPRIGVLEKACRLEA